MKEHRVVEKSLKLMILEKERMDQGNIDVDAVRALIDFITVFADESHHGKEETILFPALRGKNRSYEFDEITSNLMKEHASIRNHLRTIKNAFQWFSEGDRESAETISRELGEIAAIYTNHVVKEDNLFFNSAMKVLSEEEKEEMLCAMDEFDLDFTINHYEKLIDDKYAALADSSCKPDKP